MLAKSTAEFINEVGFDADQKTRSALFKFQRNEPDPDGNMSSQEMAVEVPLLAIVPIPNLQIDEVNVIFDMEVRQSERAETSVAASLSLSGSAGFGPVSVSISGSVSASHSNTRSSDNSAKYHVSVLATNHGIPEGLARVLDMMAANVAPNMVSSKPVDRSGNELTGTNRQRNLRLRQLMAERSQLEASENAAIESFELRMAKLLRSGDDLRNRINTRLEAAINSAGNEDGKKEPTKQIEANHTFWADFRSRAKNTVVANSSNETPKKLSEIWGNPLGKETPDDELISVIDAEFIEATKSHQELSKATEAVSANRVEYNNTMMNVSAPATPATATI